MFNQEVQIQFKTFFIRWHSLHHENLKTLFYFENIGKYLKTLKHISFSNFQMFVTAFGKVGGGGAGGGE